MISGLRRRGAGGRRAPLAEAHAADAAADVHDAMGAEAALPGPEVGAADQPLEDLGAALAVLVHDQAERPLLVPAGAARHLDLDADDAASREVDDRSPARGLAQDAAAEVRARQIPADDEGSRELARRRGQRGVGLGVLSCYIVFGYSILYHVL